MCNVIVAQNVSLNDASCVECWTYLSLLAAASTDGCDIFVFVAAACVANVV